MTSSHPDGVTLSDFVDDALTDAARADVRTHLAACAACRAIVDGLRDVQSAARRLPPLQPRQEVWGRIERGMRGTSSRSYRARWSWLAAAAALLLATLVGFTLADLRRPPPAPSTASTGASDLASAQSVEAELRQAEEHYQKAIAGLERIANAEKGALDPQTAATLEKNLSVVDQAISESRAALRAQPASEPAQASLLENFKSKIALLQDTLALINEMRKGPGTGLKQKGT